MSLHPARGAYILMCTRHTEGRDQIDTNMVFTMKEELVMGILLLSVTIACVSYIVLMNLLLIIAIFQDAEARRKLFFKLILSIAIVHFIQGVTVIPLHVAARFDIELFKDLPDVCKYWHVTELSLAVILVLLIFMLMFERFLSLTSPIVVANTCFGCLMLLSPWILGPAFTLLLFYTSNDLQQLLDFLQGNRKDSCTLGMSEQWIYTVFGFLLPSAFVFGFCWANVVIMCMLKRRYSDRFLENPMSHTTASTLVALFFIAMWLPVHCSPIMSFFNRESCPDLLKYCGFANAAITPSLWLIVPAVKKGFHCICCCGCRSCCEDSQRQAGVVHASAVDETQIRMLGQEQIQPSFTTKL
ncbi:uncharacterized protein LOC124120103 isoform X1 [Haliotis rufescens]|uniref:uncharacterized protein LOC124120103 isoform X1 n=2 Tax=Haliotis rufescens TaxID=6454 RepID=UPI00201E9407|nr:uncharacterized protein LOC124120103 isoform X1 [Haliotis rufescens]